MGNWQTRLVLRVSQKIRSARSYSNDALEKRNAKEAAKRQKYARNHQPRRSEDTQDEVNELGERDYSIFSQATTLHDNHDHTEMMHGLTHHDSFDSLVDNPSTLHKLRDPYFSSSQIEEIVVSPEHERRVAFLPPELWKRIATFLEPADAAHLAFASKTLHEKLGSKPWDALNLAENRLQRAKFLQHMDRNLPSHLLCFVCATYHVRTQAGKEVLKADYTQNPLFDCPNVKRAVLPRIRLTHGRELPYAYVQLALRADKYSSLHGVQHDKLSRNWKCKDSTWSHRTRYHVHNGHLFVRIISQTIAPPKLTETAERHLLYDREEYTPFYSVCPHWRDGELMRAVKCALSHIPSPPDPILQQLKRAPKISLSAARPNFIVRLCDNCQPMRRCPECPTEYLIEVRMVEDKTDPVRRFKHAIVVTRWSDLGDGSGPVTSPEWASLKGLIEYESFTLVGRRAVSGIFESYISGSIPGQRMLSLNPKKAKKGEDGNDWY